MNCIPFRGATLSDIQEICDQKFGYDELQKIAIKFSDGVVFDDDNVSEDVKDYANSRNIPVLPYQGKDYKDAYNQFYEQVMGGDN